MNQALATVFFERYMDRQSANPMQPWPPEVMQTFDQLYAENVDQQKQQVQPDYHRRSMPESSLSALD